MPTLIINTQEKFDAALKSGAFKSCTDASFYHLPLVAALPDLPSCTDAWFDNLPLVEALPDLPSCTWKAAYCVGLSAPDPAYSSHRVYRRPTSFLCTAISKATGE